MRVLVVAIMLGLSSAAGAADCARLKAKLGGYSRAVFITFSFRSSTHTTYREACAHFENWIALTRDLADAAARDAVACGASSMLAPKVRNKIPFIDWIRKDACSPRHKPEDIYLPIYWDEY